MPYTLPELPEGFETWLFRRAAEAVEAGEVPAELVAELHAERAAARERPQEEGNAAANQRIADLAAVPEEEAAKTLAAIEAQTSVTRELLMRRFVETWLEEQRRAYQRGGEAGSRA